MADENYGDERPHAPPVYRPTPAALPPSGSLAGDVPSPPPPSDPVPFHPQPLVAHQQMQAGPPVAVVVAKNPGVAAFLSFVWTGAGQIYNGQVGIGLLFMAVQFVNFFLLFVLIGFITFPLTWIASMIHAYSTAQDFNRRYGVIS